MNDKTVERRTILKASAGVVAASAAMGQASPASAQDRADASLPEMTEELSKSFSSPIFIATWPFGKAACERSRKVLSSGGSMRDAVERGIHVTELDTSIGSVGYGGRPNASGIVQLDASFMDGTRQQAGAVAAIEGFRNPISVARRVMEVTPHAMLAGADAAKFAEAQGFQSQPTLTDNAKKAWESWKAERNQVRTPEQSHDTIALLGVNTDGHLVGGCSTSGLAFKLPGRVGDSPIVGSGLYVDGEIGAAGATGVGENVLRYCGSFLIVEFMRQGMSPTQACEATVRRIASGENKPPKQLSVNFVAVNKAGHVGAAGTDQGFRCAVVDSSNSQVIKPKLVS